MHQAQLNKAKSHIRLERKCGFYELYIKRLMDIVCSLSAIIIFSWLYIIIAVLVRVRLGLPVLFKQPRPGKIDPKTGREKIFYMYKFRSMSDERDELPEAFNILKGDMSIIGPRPQLVRDMVFMTEEQRRRHIVHPGLFG